MNNKYPELNSDVKNSSFEDKNEEINSLSTCSLKNETIMSNLFINENAGTVICNIDHPKNANNNINTIITDIVNNNNKQQQYITENELYSLKTINTNIQTENLNVKPYFPNSISLLKEPKNLSKHKIEENKESNETENSFFVENDLTYQEFCLKIRQRSSGIEIMPDNKCELKNQNEETQNQKFEDESAKKFVDKVREVTEETWTKILKSVDINEEISQKKIEEIVIEDREEIVNYEDISEDNIQLEENEDLSINIEENYCIEETNLSEIEENCEEYPIEENEENKEIEENEENLLEMEETDTIFFDEEKEEIDNETEEKEDYFFNYNRKEKKLLEIEENNKNIFIEENEEQFFNFDEKEENLSEIFNEENEEMDNENKEEFVLNIFNKEAKQLAKEEKQLVFNIFSVQNVSSQNNTKEENVNFVCDNKLFVYDQTEPFYYELKKTLNRRENLQIGNNIYRLKTEDGRILLLGRTLVPYRRNDPCLLQSGKEEIEIINTINEENSLKCNKNKSKIKQRRRKSRKNAKNRTKKRKIVKQNCKINKLTTKSSKFTLKTKINKPKFDNSNERRILRSRNKLESSNQKKDLKETIKDKKIVKTQKKIKNISSNLENISPNPKTGEKFNKIEEIGLQNEEQLLKTSKLKKMETKLEKNKEKSLRKRKLEIPSEEIPKKKRKYNRKSQSNIPATSQDHLKVTSDITLNLNDVSYEFNFPNNYCDSNPQKSQKKEEIYKTNTENGVKKVITKVKNIQNLTEIGQITQICPKNNVKKVKNNKNVQKKENIVQDLSKSCTKNENIIKYCSLCDENFTYEQIWTHYSDHKLGNDTFFCYYCNNRFDLFCEYVTHHKNMHITCKFCPFCNKIQKRGSVFKHLLKCQKQ